MVILGPTTSHIYSVQVSLLDPACWCSLYFRILKRTSTLLGFPTREANRESSIRRLWSGFSFCMIFINSQSMTSSALVKGKPESVPAGFVSEASILRSGWIWYSSNSFRINCRSVTKAERTRIGFPENFRHSAIFGKVRGQRATFPYLSGFF